MNQQYQDSDPQPDDTSLHQTGVSRERRLSGISQLNVHLERGLCQHNIHKILATAVMLRLLNSVGRDPADVAVTFNYKRVFEGESRNQLGKGGPEQDDSPKDIALISSPGDTKVFLAEYILQSRLRGERIVAVLDGNRSTWAEALALFNQSLDSLAISPLSDDQDCVTRSLAQAFLEEPDARTAELLTALKSLHDVGDEPSQSDNPIVAELLQAMVVLDDKTGIHTIFDKSNVERLDTNEVLLQVIRNLASDNPTTGFVANSTQEYDDARLLAVEMHAANKEVSPGVYVSPETPRQERDTLARRIYEDLVKNDPSVKVLLEYSEDRRPTKLTSEDAMGLQTRIDAGEDVRKIFDDMLDMMGGDPVLYHLIEDRGRDPLGYIVDEIEKSKYIPDENGVYTFAKRPEDMDLGKILEQAQEEMPPHGNLYMIDVASGTSKPVFYMFRGSGLQSVLSVLEASLFDPEN